MSFPCISHQQASTHTIQPASHPASLIFCIFVPQALRKLRARCGARFTSFSAQPLSLTARELLHLTTPASNLQEQAYQQHRSLSLSLEALCKKYLGLLYFNVNRVWRKLGTQSAQGQKNMAQGLQQVAFLHTSGINQHSYTVQTYTISIHTIKHSCNHVLAHSQHMATIFSYGGLSLY